MVQTRKFVPEGDILYKDNDLSIIRIQNPDLYYYYLVWVYIVLGPKREVTFRKVSETPRRDGSSSPTILESRVSDNFFFPIEDTVHDGPSERRMSFWKRRPIKDGK